MFLTIIATAVLVISLTALVIIVGRKFPLLARLNETPADVQLQERKKSLIEERLRRKVSTAWGNMSARLGPVNTWTRKQWERTHQKLVNLEHEYKVRALPVLLNRRQRHKLDEEITDILTQAQALIDDGELSAAEERCLQAIRLEPRSVPAFELLGQIYREQHEYGHAKEVYLFLLKLVSEADAVYEHQPAGEEATMTLEDAEQQAAERQHQTIAYHLDLAEIYRELGEPTNAFASAQEASRLEPNNPRVLDEVLESSLLAGKKQFAEDALAKLSEVNPENQKLASWREQLDALSSAPTESALDDQAPTLYETHTTPNERS